MKKYYLVYIRLPSYSFCVINLKHLNIQLPEQYRNPRASSKAYLSLKVRTKFFKYNDQFLILAKQFGFQTFIGTHFFIFDEEGLKLFEEEFERLKYKIVEKIAEDFAVEIDQLPPEIKAIYEQQFRQYFATERFKIFKFQIYPNEDVIKSVLMTLYNYYERLSRTSSKKRREKLIMKLKEELERIFEFFEFSEEDKSQFVKAFLKFSHPTSEDDFISYIDTILGTKTENNNSMGYNVSLEEKRRSLKYIVYKLEEYFFEEKRGQMISIDEAIEKIMEWKRCSKEEAIEVLREIKDKYSEKGFVWIKFMGHEGIWFDNPIYYVLSE